MHLITWEDFNFFCARTGEVSIISFTTIAGAPVGKASGNFTLMFSLSTGLIRNWSKKKKKKMEKHDKILMLAKSDQMVECSFKN